MKQYTNTAKLLHWLVAGLIVSQYVLAELAKSAKQGDQILDQLALLANHKSIGITILALALIRLVYRFRNPAPELPPSMSAWQVWASKASHFLLYAFLLALPITGWLMSSAKSYSVSYFNLLALPDFVAPNERLAEQLQSSHYYLGEALFYIALLHILAALKHHFFDKDDVLAKMSNKFVYAVFVFVCAATILIFGRLFSSVPTENSPISKQVAQTESLEFSLSSLDQWNIDYQQSSIKFIGDQAGAPFEGEWQQWTAAIQFDPNKLEDARFDVSIDLRSGFSNDQERDDTIRSEEFFHAEKFPSASYQANDFSVSENGFVSQGRLSIKGITADVPLEFSVTTTDQGGQRLVGKAELDRFAWGIGTGQWLDTTWVGQQVLVKVRVVTKPK